MGRAWPARSSRRSPRRPCPPRPSPCFGGGPDYPQRGRRGKGSELTRVTRILCAAEPRGSVDAIEGLLEVAGERDVHAVALVGDLSGDGREDYRAVFKALGGAKLPAYWVPGPDDAPIDGYLREAYNAEVVFPLIHGVHASAAFSPDGHVLFAGLGGEVSDE